MVQLGIIPAYAGSTLRRYGRLSPRPDHPRIRGEHPGDGDVHDYDQGSSPHTRGAPRKTTTSGSTTRIIPAYAGSTGQFRHAAARPSDHPRIRGEHYANSVYPALAAGSSPHTRGALVRERAVGDGARIIPAYAGSTLPPEQAVGSSADHPRIRGEHGKIGYGEYNVLGSSPHTRGARSAKRLTNRSGRIIPAYAGSTSVLSVELIRCPDHPRIRGEHGMSPVRAR